MRLYLRAVVLVAVFAMTVAPISANAAEIPRVGSQVKLFAAPTTYAADEPFHIAHGFGVEGASDSSVSAIPDYDFTLIVDGEEVHGARAVVVEDGQWQTITWIFNFRDGLPAGDHTFEGIWQSPDGPDSAFQPTIEFVESCGA